MMDSLICPKRQRTSADAGLASLPDGVLASIGDYLALPSRLLFSVALAAPSSSWGGRRCNEGISVAGLAVVPPGSVTALDFEEVEKELAERLSDDDLGAVLAILDAGHTLLKLKLANCLNITGRGLEPLRGSTALQFIDLSLVGQFVNVSEIEDPEVEGGVLSIAIVTPVLQSIIDAEGNALRYLALPHKWRAALSEPLALFHRNYAQHLYDKSQPCAGENCRNPVGVHRMRRCNECSEQPCVCYSAWFGYSRMGGGFQDYTCYECGAMYCESCNDDLEPLNYCDSCEKNYCTKHLSFAGCGACETTNCSGCRSTVVCSQPECGFVCCSNCEPDYMQTCEVCGEKTCDDCYMVHTCEDCNRKRCRSCCEVRFCNRFECNWPICNDCQPPDPGWECLWCKDDPDARLDYFGDYVRPGPRCTRCFERAKTHCHYCEKVKLREEDYLAPSVPSSYWTLRGYDEAYVESMKKFLQEMKALTLKLKSGEEFSYHVALEGTNGIVLRHDDILLPHWREFTEALRQYNLGAVSDTTCRLSNLELHSSVPDMLNQALKAKSFRALEMTNVVGGANGVQFAVDFVRNNPKLDLLYLVELRVDNVECLRRLFEAFADHPSLKYIRLDSICGERMTGNDLLPLTFSLLHGTKTYERIDLRSNNIRTNGATDLPDFIASNSPSLTCLNLDNNQLGDTDALLIAKALKQNTTLKSIGLRGNDFTEVGHNALLSAVCDCASVKTVVASNHTCHLDDVGIDYYVSNCEWLRTERTTMEEMRIGKKIYYYFSTRNGKGSNGHHLALELGDMALKLSPNVLEHVLRYAPSNSGKFRDERNRCVRPLSILYEIVRSWKLPCREGREEVLQR